MKLEPLTRQVGRPVTKATDGEKATLGIRAAPGMKSKLIEAAKRNGRSLSAEAELRLEQSFQIEAMLDEAWGLIYGSSGRDLMKLIGCAIRYAPTSEADWINDPLQYNLVIGTLIPLLTEDPIRPPGEIGDDIAWFGKGRKEALLRLARRDVIAALHGKFNEAAAKRIGRWLSDADRKPDQEETT
jgi:hypothetical protein